MSPACCEGRTVSEDDVLEVLGRHQGRKVLLRELAKQLNLDDEELRLAIIRLRSKSSIGVFFDRYTGELIIGSPEAGNDL